MKNKIKMYFFWRKYRWCRKNELVQFLLNNKKIVRMIKRQAQEMANRNLKLQIELINLKKELAYVTCSYVLSDPTPDHKLYELCKDNKILAKAMQEGFDMIRNK